MMQRLKQNLWKAVSEVGVSVIGSLGIVLIISGLISLGPEAKSGWAVFKSYFDGGEIGLSVLSLSGAIYLLLNRLGQQHEGMGLPIYLLSFLPVIIAAFIVGSNPGFEPTKIGNGQLVVLGLLYLIVHVFWFILLLVQPPLPNRIKSPEKAAQEQAKSASGIEKRAQGRVG